MKRVIIGALLALTCFGATPALEACGDKYMLPGRGLSFFEAYRARHPGSVLLYAPAGTASAEFASVAAHLTRAGHKVTAVNDLQEIAGQGAALNADIVLAPVASLPDVESRTTRTGPPPSVLPLLVTGSKAEVASCKQRQALCKLKLKDPLNITETVNNTMNQRTRAAAPKRQGGR